MEYNNMEKNCEEFFKAVKEEMSDDRFMDIQKAIGIWPLPSNWPIPEESNDYITFPEKGICIIKCPYPGELSFKISISVKMDEIRIGFLFPPEFNHKINRKESEINDFISKEFEKDNTFSKNTNVIFEEKKDKSRIIDFIYYNQFADSSRYCDISYRSMAATVSHLYCSIIDCVIEERDSRNIDKEEGVVDKVIIVEIDPEIHEKDQVVKFVEDKIRSQNGRLKSATKMAGKQYLFHCEWKKEEAIIDESTVMSIVKSINKEGIKAGYHDMEEVSLS